MAITVTYDDPVRGRLNGTAVPPDIRALAQEYGRGAVVTGRVTLDSSYPSGGYANQNAKFGLATVGEVYFGSVGGGVRLQYDRGNDKIAAYGQALSVNTTVTSALAATGSQTVTPGAMTNIAVGSVVLIDSAGTPEWVIVTAVTGSTFTAVFNHTHSGGFKVEGWEIPNAVDLSGLQAVDFRAEGNWI